MGAEERAGAGRRPGLTVLCIYRQRNGPHVERLLDGADQLMPDVRLWALDQVASPLAPLTVGEGPGAKFDLLNRLIACKEVSAGHHLAVVDDDVAFVRGDLAL